MDLLTAARFEALGIAAVTNALIASWDAKYTYMFWRPITAIRAGDTDGNPETLADPTWTPLIATPPHPSYSSGHSTFGGAAATALAGCAAPTEEVAESESAATTTLLPPEEVSAAGGAR